MEAVLTGLFSLGYGRTEMLAKRSSGLEKRKYEFVQEAVDYACSLGMALCRSQEAEARGSKLVVRGGDIVDENEDDGDPDRERRYARQQHSSSTGKQPRKHPLTTLPPSPSPSPFRLWHFRRWASRPSPPALLVLVPQPTVKPLRMELAQWYAQRVAPRAQQLITRLIDLRRLRYAIEMNGEASRRRHCRASTVGRTLPNRSSSLKHTTLAGGTADGTAGYAT